MTSAFFLGAFVTAHFLMPRSSIHLIHSLNPFTIGRPLSTAKQPPLNKGLDVSTSAALTEAMRFFSGNARITPSPCA